MVYSFLFIPTPYTVHPGLSAFGIGIRGKSIVIFILSIHIGVFVCINKLITDLYFTVYAVLVLLVPAAVDVGVCVCVSKWK